MSLKKSFWPAVMAVCIIGASVYMSSWDVRNEETHSPVMLSGEETISVQGKAAGAAEDPYDLENKLVGTKQVMDDGIAYKVETYQEFEIFKSEDGSTVKEIPTANFNYLRYRVEK
ncbi:MULTISPECIES: hypothetical protein [Bacillaceae]|uniref:DUF3221 domain-containing protein n=1 Tax=Metabacillus sediminis TaxID=3117746 RepID=A0ABZ2NL75_9BACI|nr:hypothetical protein [Bacillus sp. SJS]KZZ83615.1 hypothetical protein AS29_015010 [Bacillus sp. SJS]